MIVGMFLIRDYYHKRELRRQPENKILERESEAEQYKKQALEDPLHGGKEHFKHMLDKTEDDYIRLKERFRHDDEKQLEFLRIGTSIQNQLASFPVPTMP